MKMYINYICVVLFFINLTSCAFLQIGEVDESKVATLKIVGPKFGFSYTVYVDSYPFRSEYSNPIDHFILPGYREVVFPSGRKIVFYAEEGHKYVIRSYKGKYLGIMDKTINKWIARE